MSVPRLTESHPSSSILVSHLASNWTQHNPPCGAAGLRWHRSLWPHALSRGCCPSPPWSGSPDLPCSWEHDLPAPAVTSSQVNRTTMDNITANVEIKPQLETWGGPWPPGLRPPAHGPEVYLSQPWLKPGLRGLRRVHSRTAHCVNTIYPIPNISIIREDNLRKHHILVNLAFDGDIWRHDLAIRGNAGERQLGSASVSDAGCGLLPSLEPRSRLACHDIKSS